MHVSHRLAFWAAVSGFLVLSCGIYASYVMWPDFNPLKQTLSSLAALDAPTRGMITAVMLSVGCCQLIIAWGFKFAEKYGRALIGLSGCAVFGVAAFPVPSVFADSNWHTFMAGIVLIAMCLWPIFSIRQHPVSPWLLTVRGAWTTTVIQAVVGLVFLAAWLVNHSLTGLLEMALLTTQSGFVIAAIWSSAQHVPRLVTVQTNELVATSTLL